VKQEYEYYWQKSVKAAAERVLSEVWDAPVRLGEPAGIWVYPDECRPTIQRARVLVGPAGAPASVILKRIHWIDPYDPDDVQPTGGTSAPHENPTMAWRLISEWTGTQSLSRFGGEPPLCPQFYGGDLAEGFVILGDLGTGETLEDLLQGEDPVSAEAALMGYATALGRMHAGSCGREAEYDRLWEVLGKRTTLMREIEARILREACHRLKGLAERFGVRWPHGTEREIETVLAAFREPGPFAALTLGDYCPVNTMFVNGGLYLFDFERAAFRHALFDGCIKPHHSAWLGNRLPAELEERFAATYRSELIRSCPEASDEARYRHAALEMRAAWLLWRLEADVKEAQEQEYPQQGQRSEADPGAGLSLRQRTLLVLEGFAEEAKQIGHLEALGAVSRCLAERLRARWQPAPGTLRLFPTFSQSHDLASRSSQ
jgi:hypothetical protein